MNLSGILGLISMVAGHTGRLYASILEGVLNAVAADNALHLAKPGETVDVPLPDAIPAVPSNVANGKLFKLVALRVQRVDHPAAPVPAAPAVTAPVTAPAARPA